MFIKEITSFLITSIVFVSISTAQNNNFQYAYVEKISGYENTTHYAHIVLKGNRLTMNRIVVYADSAVQEPVSQEINETYYLTDSEIDQLEGQLISLIDGSKMPELTKVKKESILLSDNIEEEINLNSKRSLIVISEENYYIEYEIKRGEERDKMVDSEVKKFMALERMLKNIAKPIQKIYRQKRGKYRQLFDSL